MRSVSSGVQEKSYSPVSRYSGHALGIDGADLRPQIAVDAIEVEVALEHAGAALLVHPQRLVPRHVGALRRHQTRDQRRADFAAVHVGTIEPGGVVPGLLEVGRLQPDQRAEASRRARWRG